MSVRVKVGGIVVCLVLLVAGPALIWDGVTDYRTHCALDRDGVRTRADAFDWRIVRGRGGTHYDLRYAFTVPTGERYTNPGDYGRDVVWVAIDREEWDRSQQTDEIEVA